MVDVKINYDGETSDLQTLINNQIENIKKDTEIEPEVVPQQQVVQQPQQQVVQQPQQQVVQQPQQQVIQQPQQQVIQQRQQQVVQQPQQQKKEENKIPSIKIDKAKIKLTINGEKISDINEFIEKEIEKKEESEIKEPESGIEEIEKETQKQQEQIEQEKQEAEQFHQQIVQQIQQQEPETKEDITKQLTEKIALIKIKIEEINKMLEQTECKNSSKEENLEEPYDQEIIKCKEVDGKILIHFEKRRANAEKFGDIIANIKYYGDIPEYTINNYNEIYKNFDDKNEQDTFLIKEPIIGEERPF